MNIKNIRSVVKKEIMGYLNSPASYIVAIVFLLLWEFMYFRNAFLIGESSLRNLYGLFPWMMLILVPAVTMGSVAKEKDDGTLEFILTQPINELEYVIGKFLGALFFITTVLLFVVPVALSISRFGPFDWGVFCRPVNWKHFICWSLYLIGYFCIEFGWEPNCGVINICSSGVFTGHIRNGIFHHVIAPYFGGCI